MENEFSDIDWAGIFFPSFPPGSFPMFSASILFTFFLSLSGIVFIRGFWVILKGEADVKTSL